jgi:hypothetical protein
VGPYIHSGKVFYMPKGLVVGDISLAREVDLVPSLPEVVSVPCCWLLWLYVGVLSTTRCSFVLMLSSFFVEGPCLPFYSPRRVGVQRVGR